MKPTKSPWRFRLNLVALVALLIIAIFAVVTQADAGVALDRGIVSLSTSRPTGLVICEVFGDRYCGQALRVAWCESRLDTRARNGQYRGLWQMGRWERRKYGHGSDAMTQTRAAYRYFVATGRDWSPWTCRWAA